MRLAAFGLREQVIAIFGPGSFLGELDMLTGQAATFSARMPLGGVIQRMPRPVFRQLTSDDPELSDIILKAFMARREFLRTSEAARSVQIVGGALSAETLELRNWATRLSVPHTWLDVETDAGYWTLKSFGLDVTDLPVVITPTAILRNAIPSVLAGQLGLAYRSVPGKVYDVIVAGGGPPDWRLPSTAPLKAWTRWCWKGLPQAGKPARAHVSRTTSAFRPASPAGN